MNKETSRCVEIIRHCSTGNDGNHCKECPYLNSDTLEKPCVNILFSDAADLIESLSKQLEQVTRERDAAAKDLKLIISGDLSCAICGHYAYDEDDESRICADCDVDTYSNWQWRGVEVEG